MSDDDEPSHRFDQYEPSPLDEPGEEPDQEAPPNVADKRGYERQSNRIKRETREAEQFWQGVFASPIGRREMWRILIDTHAFEERFACGPNGFPNEQATWFHAGEQAFGLRLYHTWLRDHVGAVAAMHAENDPRFRKAKS